MHFGYFPGAAHMAATITRTSKTLMAWASGLTLYVGRKLFHSQAVTGSHCAMHVPFFDPKDEEEIILPTDPTTGKVDYIEFDSPIELIQAVLYRNGQGGMSVDKLCAVSRKAASA